MVHLPSWMPADEQDAFKDMIHHQVERGYKVSEYFAYAVSGTILLYAIPYWSRRLYHRLSLDESRPCRAIGNATRPFRKYSYGQRVGSWDVSPERVLLATAYFGINTLVSFLGVKWTPYTIFANRLGWVSLANMLLAILLGLKNTPLSPIAGRSYESLNHLHRLCGYTTISLMVLHTVIYIIGLFKFDADWLLTSIGTFGADVAGVAMLCILITANSYVRKRHYELFYVTHVFLVMVTIVTASFHTSKAATQALIMALICACLWFLDRSLRLSRWLYYLPGNYATLTPLPEGATRVTLRRGMRGAPGSHAFLYIPAVRKFQAHPFTMAGRQPVEFVISARGGFTKALHEMACGKPGRVVRAGVEGPYGNVPDTHAYDRVVLFVGGSGVTFAISLAMDWVRRRKSDGKVKKLELVWSVRSAAHLQWFSLELAELCEHPDVTLRVHVTKRPSRVATTDVTLPISLPEKVHVVKAIAYEQTRTSDETARSARTFNSTLSPELAHVEKVVSYEQTKDTRDVERAAQRQASCELTDAMPSYATYGRPDVDNIIQLLFSTCSERQRVLVAACGPAGLSTSCREAVAACTKRNAPSVTLHTEAFGW